MKFLAVSPEAGDWTKLSPLAGAVNHLTEAYARVGTEVLTCSPFYPALLGDISAYSCVFSGIEHLRNMPFEVWKNPHSLHTYIRCDEYFARPAIYGESGYSYSDNHLRFSFLASAALTYCAEIDFQPIAICGHDWGGALVGALAKSVYKDLFGTLPFFFTVHNITYDFHVTEQEIEKIGLSRADFNMDGYEFWGKVSLLKAGLFYASKVLFPSPGYREAMLNSNLPGGLSGFLCRNEKKLKGIQFGVSYPVWDFNIEADLPIEDAKRHARKKLEAHIEKNFDDHLVMYCHLDEESGRTSETLATILADITKLNFFVIVGVSHNSPEGEYYRSVAGQNPGQITTMDISPDDNELKMVLAGADILFAANPREPSASLVLKALAAGTVPLTGKEVGCANLLANYDGDFKNANAMLVDDAAAPDQMLRKLKEVADLFAAAPENWENIVRNAYRFRYEWDRTISQYLITFGECC